MLVGRRPRWWTPIAAILLVVTAVCPPGMVRAVTAIDEGHAPLQTGEQLDDVVDADVGRFAGVRASARADEEGSGEVDPAERPVVPVVLSAHGEALRRDTRGILVDVRGAVCRSGSNRLCGDRAPPASV